MKTRKLVTTSFLSAAFLLANLASPASAETAFTDIPNNYAKDAIYQLVNLGIINGTGNGKFNPNGNITRQDFAIVLSRTLNLNTSTPPQTATFKDVSSDSYAFAAVEAVYKAGLVSGTGNGKFAGTQPLTREQIAVICVNALGVDANGKGASLGFTDSSSISPWAKDYVAAALEYKLMTGNPDGSFDPLANASRQQMALVTSKFIAKKAELEQEQAEIPSTNPEQEPVIEPEKPTQQPSTPVTYPTTSPTAPPSTTPTVPDSNPEPTPNPNPTPNPEPALNAAPVANDLSFVFEEETEELVVGQQISVNFKYQDLEDDEQQSVKYAWYRSSNSEGRERELIPNADNSSYTFTSDDVDHYISVEVTPIAATGTTTGLTSYKILDRVVMEPVIEDTTPPLIDTTKFYANDNYSGTDDQLYGIEDSVSEENAVVLAYPWIDTNNIGVIDEGELGDPITLGLSNADGSVNHSNIGDLAPGEYKFVITATDDALNESQISADYSVTVLLNNGMMPTVTSNVYGFDGGELRIKEFEAGSQPYAIRFDYNTPPAEYFDNGTVTVTVEGISFGTEDYYIPGDGWRHFTEDQISNDGQTVTISGVNGYTQNVAFELRNQIIPNEGSYRIIITADADGSGINRSESIQHVFTLVSKTPLIP